MSTGGELGAAGGRGSTTFAATRIDVLDPHVLIMMRDVMGDIDSAPRLKPNGGAGGGGGGGGGATDGGTGTAGTAGETPSALTSVIVPMPATKGAGGSGGDGGADGGLGTSGGGGGAGAGGSGGVVVIITQSNDTDVGFGTSKITVAAGEGGIVGGSSAGQDGEVGQDGPDGKVVYIRV